MAIFKIKFKHTVEITYEANVEAESEEQARVYFDDSPFDYVQGDGEEGDGVSIDIISITESE